MIHGIGSSVYWTLGLAYLDDSTSKDKAPLAHAASQCIGLMGPTIGYTLASQTLSMYVDPSLHPRIDNEDPRWIGAWWLGWIPQGVGLMLVALAILLFPRQLPSTARRAARRAAAAVTPNVSVEVPAVRRKFMAGLRHMTKNKILMYNTFSGVCFVFANVGYYTFMPKYLETMYLQSTSSASLISGSIGLLSAGLGTAASGFVLSRFKPSARYVAGWNVAVEIVDSLCKFGWVFLSCGPSRLQGGFDENGSWNLTTDCNKDRECDPNLKFSPVCSTDGSMAFFSSCHAGCTSTAVLLNGTTMYNNCSCVPDNQVRDGRCSMDCVTNFTIYLVSQVILQFLEASGKAGNLIIQFRCVHQEDKPLAAALFEFLISILAFIPAPIIFGALLDSACLIWDQTCGKSGNCWIYHDDKLRNLINYSSCFVTIIGTLLDVGVWYYASDLKLYEDEEERNVSNGETNILALVHKVGPQSNTEHTTK